MTTSSNDRLHLLLENVVCGGCVWDAARGLCSVVLDCVIDLAVTGQTDDKIYQREPAQENLAAVDLLGQLHQVNVSVTSCYPRSRWDRLWWPLSRQHVHFALHEAGYAWGALSGEVAGGAIPKAPFGDSTLSSIEYDTSSAGVGSV